MGILRMEVMKLILLLIICLDNTRAEKLSGGSDGYSSEQGAPTPSLITNLMERVKELELKLKQVQSVENSADAEYATPLNLEPLKSKELEIMLKKVLSVEDPTLEERLAAVEIRAELNRVATGRHEQIIGENQLYITNNTGNIAFMEETRPPVGSIVSLAWPQL